MLLCIFVNTKVSSRRQNAVLVVWSGLYEDPPFILSALAVSSNPFFSSQTLSSFQRLHEEVAT